MAVKRGNSTCFYQTSRFLFRLHLLASPMSHSRQLSRIARRRWVSWIGLGEHGRSVKIAPWRCPDRFLGSNASNLHTACSRCIHEPSAASRACPIGPGIRCFSHSAVPEAFEEEDEDAAMEKPTWLATVAQRALVDYLHITRGMSLGDAEHMSKHSPIFLSKLLEKVKRKVAEEIGEDGKREKTSTSMWVRKRAQEAERVGKALSRFFNYHPINEFELFFESIGLKPSEFDPLLPPDLMFLSDDEMLLENYRVLWTYGVPRSNIGKIYRDATEVFGDDGGVLVSRLRALEELGLSKSSVIKLVAASPVVLQGAPDADFVKVLQWLDYVGIARNWIGGVLSEKRSYNWGKMPILFVFFKGLGFSKGSIGDLIRQHPDFMLDGSGKMVSALAVILLKAGAGRKELFGLFSTFPNVLVGNFAKNLRNGIRFLFEIRMGHEDIKKLVVSYPMVLGSAALKKPRSITTNLNAGKERLCEMIMEEPQRLMKYTIGSRVRRLPKSDGIEKSFEEKVKFLTSIGFDKGSEDMKEALKVFRGKGDKLKDRYEFLVKTGFDPKDAVNMIKVAPHVLNQKIPVLEAKIAFLVNNIGYPLSSLVSFPSYLSYTTDRVNLRFSMYRWLRDRGVAKPELALSTILTSSETSFMKKFVMKHPKGPEVWENYKRANS